MSEDATLEKVLEDCDRNTRQLQEGIDQLREILRNVAAELHETNRLREALGEIARGHDETAISAHSQGGGAAAMDGEALPGYVAQEIANAALHTEADDERE